MKITEDFFKKTVKVYQLIELLASQVSLTEISLNGLTVDINCFRREAQLLVRS